MNQKRVENKTRQRCHPETSPRFRAPVNDGEILLAPPLEQVQELLTENQSRLQNVLLRSDQKSFAEYRKQTRREILELARQYTHQLSPETDVCTRCSIEELLKEKPLFVTGHQPELFHAGVWVKNLLINRLAKQHHGISLNVIVDSDAIKSNRISIPVIEDSNVALKKIPIDNWRVGVPWEELQVENEKQFHSFAQRVSRQLLVQQSQPILIEFWKDVVDAIQQTGSVTSAFTAARVRFEQTLGIHNLEVPLSQIAQTSGYRAFIAGLILRSREFVEIYNRSLSCYRTTNRIHSTLQPVPDLSLEDGWYELPVWIWKQGETVRQSLFVTREQQTITLSNLRGWDCSFSIADSQNERAFVSEQLLRLQQAGYKIRTKALMTTAFLRLYLADWFVHGIGGARYDEITDRIINQFWQTTAPKFHVATGTFHLPIQEKIDAPAISSHELMQRYRYAIENPEILMNPVEKSRQVDLLTLKADLIRQQKDAQVEGLTRRERRERHSTNKIRYSQLKSVRNQLQQLVQPSLQNLAQQIESARQVEQNRRVMRNREYPLCCFPQENLLRIKEDIFNR